MFLFMVATDLPIRPQAPDLASASLAEILRAVADKRLPPVEQWNPPHCGHSQMKIDGQGRWWHQGRPIQRAAMVQLFAKVLRREADGSFVLVTPVEKLAIDVEDAPFQAIELATEGHGKGRSLSFRLNSDELLLAGPKHPIYFRSLNESAPRPYLHVRGPIGCGLEALISRSVFYQLAELALEEAGDNPQPIGLYSGGAFFAFLD